MLTESIKGVMTRELRTLRRQVEAFPDEASIWRHPSGIANSAGTLILHLTGNLQYFIGAVLGDTGYVRDRQAEFERRDVPRAELLAEIDRALDAVEATLTAVDADRLTSPFPIRFGDSQVTTADFLVHLATHLAFHLGQIDYHRRLVTTEATSLRPLAISELASFGKPE